MSTATIETQTLNEVFSMRFQDEQQTETKSDLKIPEYQRPYRWKAYKHVKQLLIDILREVNSEEYRIGSLIIHCNKEKQTLDIVDGQQRLITLTIILYCIQNSGNLPLLNHKFSHKDSKNNITKNHAYIYTFLQKQPKEKVEKIHGFILKHCTFNVIKVHELSEDRKSVV